MFLALTGIRAYVQLAVFAGLSLALSCVLAMLALPLLLKREHQIAEIPLPGRFTIPRWLPLLLLPPAVWGGTVLLKHSDFSLESLDGTPGYIRMQERDFDRAWRAPDSGNAILAASGKDADEALEHLRLVCHELNRAGIVYALPPVPPEKEQRSLRSRWRTPETADRIRDLELRTRAACLKHGLPEKFFQPFFDRLRNAVASDSLDLPPMLDSVMKKMVKEHPGGASAVAILPDDPDSMPKIRGLLKRYGGGHCALLSKEYFRRMILDELGGRFLWILPLSILSALLLAFAVFRKISDVLLAMTPVFVSFCGLFLLGGLTGSKATPAAAFALILLTGLAVDYGIYAVSQLRNPEMISARSSVLLSALTTVAGAGALVLSRHPALFWTGVVLSVGIALACLSGLYLVPLMKKGKTSVLPAVMLFLLFSSGSVSGKEKLVPVEPDRLPQYPQTAFRLRANAVVRWRKEAHSVILAAELDPAGKPVKIVGISPGSGLLIFRVDDTHENDRWTIFQSGGSASKKAERRTDAPSFGERAGNFFLYPVRRCAAWLRKMRRDRIFRQLSRALVEDFRRIFLLKTGNGLAGEDKGEYIVVREKDGTEWEIRPDSVLHRDGSAWECEYRDLGRTVLYRNLEWNYSIRIRDMELTAKENGK